MSYATIDDIRQWIDEEVLVQLTDDADVGAVDTDVVTTVLEHASVEIDGYLGSRYGLPLSSPPAVLKKLCVDIGGYLLHVRRAAGAPEHWLKRYENAVAFLEKVAAGRISLGAGDPDGTGSSETVELTGPSRIFDRDSMKGW